MQIYYKNQSGYTLVELSIALSIIVLLISAILVGTNLVASTESKALLSEVQKFNESISQFQSLYKGVPGDLTNANSYWYSLTAAANGNGDGKIASETSNEAFYAIQELSLAGLIDGSYNGFTGTWGSGFVLANPSRTGNVLGAKGRVGAGLYMKCCSGTDYTRSSLSFNNHVSLFSVYSADSTKRGGAITPIEAYFLDQKVDDGVPDTGLVVGEGSYNGSAYASTGCYSNTGSSSKYNANTSPDKDLKGCQMMFAYDWN